MDYPILMADIIDSRKRDSKKLMVELKKLVTTINKKWGTKILSPLTITLGDEFQGVIKNIESTYEIIFDIEELIISNGLKLKLRYVLNYGKIDTKINKNIAYEMLGSGLTIARERLKDLKSNKNRFLIILNRNDKIEEAINDVFKLYENYIDNWKYNEYVIVKEFLKNRNYKDVARVLNVNASTSWRRFKSLNIKEYSICKKLILDINKMTND